MVLDLARPRSSGVVFQACADIGGGMLVNHFGYGAISISGMLDTSRAAAQVQEGVQRKLHPSERVRIAMEVSLTARALTRARLRQ